MLLLHAQNYHSVKRVMAGCTKQISRWSTVGLTLQLHYFDLFWIFVVVQVVLTLTVVSQLARF